jgi:hypothetical protein
MKPDIDKTLAIAKAMGHEGACILNNGQTCYLDQDDRFYPLEDGDDSQMVQAHFRITVDICAADWKPQIISSIDDPGAEFSSTYISNDAPTPELIRRAIFESAWLSIEGEK